MAGEALQKSIPMFKFGVALGSATRPGANTGSFEADLPFTAGYGDSMAAQRTTTA